MTYLSSSFLIVHSSLFIPHFSLFSMTAVVIAGGQSRRMRTDKAFIEIGGKRLIERVLDVIVPLFSQVYINSNKPEYYQEWGIPVIQDLVKDKGALGGIYTGLVQASTDYVFCVACDMPSLNRDLIRYMTEQVKGFDVLVPKAPDGFYPLHAVYAKRCIPFIEEMFRNNTLKISGLFAKVSTGYLTVDQISLFDPTLESFLNVNTLQELAVARKKYRL
jgi:molybdopterin-guanine dinucleotide biosynthesis protein A